MDEEITPEDIADVLEHLIKMGLIEIIGYANDGEPLYKFSEELLNMPEFYEAQEAITNELLFNIWNKGFVEMNPLNEDGDWDIRLCEKSEDFVSAKDELEEDEFLLFIQIYQDLKREQGMVE